MTIYDYSSDPTLLALIADWKESGRCCWVLQDWCLERGLQTEALAAKWAWVREIEDGFVIKGRKHTYPDSTVNSRRGGLYYWWKLPGYFDSIPETVFDRIYPEQSWAIEYGEREMTFTDCILALLHNWTEGAELELETVK